MTSIMFQGLILSSNRCSIYMVNVENAQFTSLVRVMCIFMLSH